MELTGWFWEESLIPMECILEQGLFSLPNWGSRRRKRSPSRNEALGEKSAIRGLTGGALDAHFEAILSNCP